MADFGGAMGLWLGASLITMFEFLEYFLDLWVVCCCRCRGDKLRPRPRKRANRSVGTAALGSATPVTRLPDEDTVVMEPGEKSPVMMMYPSPDVRHYPLPEPYAMQKPQPSPVVSPELSPKLSPNSKWRSVLPPDASPRSNKASRLRTQQPPMYTEEPEAFPIKPPPVDNHTPRPITINGYAVPNSNNGYTIYPYDSRRDFE